MLEVYSTFMKLWQYISVVRRKQLAFLLIVMMISSLAEILSIGAVLPFMGALMEPQHMDNLPFLQILIKILKIANVSSLVDLITTIFIASVLFAGAMRLLLIWMQTRLCFSIGSDLSSQIYIKTLYQPYTVHVSRNSSKVIAGISSKTNSVIYSSILPMLFMISSTMIVIAILGALLVLEPGVALITIASLSFVYVLIIFVTKNRVYEDSKRVNKKTDLVIKTLQEGLGGIRDVLVDGTQETYCDIYRKADLALRRSQASILIIRGSPRFLIETISICIIAVLAYWLVTHESGASGTFPVMGALAVSGQRLLPLIQQLYSNWMEILGNQSYLKDVISLLDQPLPKRAGVHKILPISFTRSIRLHNISFRYSSASSDVLKDIDIEISKGSITGIIGVTGSGKSTLIDIIMALMTPSKGSLIIDDICIDNNNSPEWQARIAHVPQHIFLADATISENIAFGVPQKLIDYKRVEFAATHAQIAADINDLENKYETMVGERGIRLSGGQLQRIGIARALYKKADVVIFDEATSALDANTERLVMEGINSIGQEMTIIIVAHRLTTLSNCSKIIELEKGSIKKIRTYKEIL